MAKVIMIHPDRCTGCRHCESACALKHEGSKRRGAACVQTFTWKAEHFSVPLMCQQCDNAACVNICRTGAMHHGLEDSNLVVFDRAACVGCKMCVVACPYGNVRYDTVTRSISKCDTCGGSPHCVEACASGALEYVEDLDQTRARRLAVGEALLAVFQEAK
jgi:carbon-monoxide dehydrogenase iron sulfur subunit